MKKWYSIFFLLLVLSSCDDEINLISKDFSVSLKAIEPNAAMIGKPVKCTFLVDGLDQNNPDELYTTFQAAGDGIVVVNDQEYTPGESLPVDYKKDGKFTFDFIPAVEGAQVFVMTVASETITRSDSVILSVENPEIILETSKFSAMAVVGQESEFYLLVKTKQYDVKASVNFLKGGGQVKINGNYVGSEGVKLEDENLVSFVPEISGQTIIEFTVSGRYGLPVKTSVVFFCFVK